MTHANESLPIAVLADNQEAVTKVERLPEVTSTRGYFQDPCLPHPTQVELGVGSL